jgi:hypothetical protein
MGGLSRRKLHLSLQQFHALLTKSSSLRMLLTRLFHLQLLLRLPPSSMKLLQ